ncbi:MAG: formate C-acetyltransferase [Ruminococcaceae bacterium]|nr:formate C-acetyltransferase [Oscillospiraceae bacterium]
MSFWNGFKGEKWKNEINVSDFISENYTEYTGDDSFLEGITPKTEKILSDTKELLKKEHENGGVLDVDTSTVTSLLNFGPGYVDKENEVIVGLQTDAPLKRGVNPFGGIRMARGACEAYGYKLSDEVENQFKYKTTHNDGVFSVYTDEMRRVRKAGILTGLPDAYGRGRIIGDYRRVALYGVDRLIEEKIKDKKALAYNNMTEENIRLSEEIYKQISFLEALKKMALMYGYDISVPAKNAREAVQWLYFAYLGAVKEQNGAAMSLGRNTAFLDIYIKRDIDNGILDEKGAQELVDQFVLKLRIVRHLRTPEYNDLFGGDPVWITESIGGMFDDKKSYVTKTAYRFMHTLYNLGTAPEPNITILWSEHLPESFKKYVAKVSIDTDSIQYENDDIMREKYGNDYAIACCVSAMQVGKQMQFFGARCNLAKLLLMALNGGKNEKDGVQVGPVIEPVSDGVLDYEDVLKRFNVYKEWLCRLYVNTMNVIHYMHDKYAYEKLQMALHDTNVGRFMAFGVAGLSVLCDSLSAIKYAKVTPVKNEDGIVCDFTVEGDFPKYGNDDDRVDMIACEILEDFYNELTKTPTYKNAKHTLSVLTITSNVVYGKKTGATPDGRKCGEPFAPGANPMHNRETNGALASLNSVSKISYDYCQDGISNTFTIVPEALGKTKEERIDNLVAILNGYFINKAHHINVNVMNRDILIDCYNHPEKYPNLTIRVSGYAVNFHKLNKEQQQEVIKRTFHGNI